MNDAHRAGKGSKRAVNSIVNLAADRVAIGQMNSHFEQYFHTWSTELLSRTDDRFTELKWSNDSKQRQDAFLISDTQRLQGRPPRN
jgi:hypothetical protein